MVFTISITDKILDIINSYDTMSMIIGDNCDHLELLSDYKESGVTSSYSDYMIFTIDKLLMTNEMLGPNYLMRKLRYLIIASQSISQTP